tara:strand:+ start:370 stop:894 length:525 start_codon:yes stop_codon:yes gene_type:complete
MDLNYLIIDNFLDKPDIVRESVICGDIPFDKEGDYPGLRCDPIYVDNGYRQMVANKISKVFPYKFKFNETTSHCFAFQLCLEGAETWVHKDIEEWAGILYLTPDANLESGTIMFDDDLAKDESSVNVTNIVHNIYNRMILFRGGIIPHRSMISGFGDSLDTGRLTQVFFFDVEE